MIEFFAKKMEARLRSSGAEHFFAKKMEAPTGIEPVYAVLQTAA